MKHLISILFAVSFAINANAQKAMTNHTDARVPPARAVRPVQRNNISERKIPVLRMGQDENEISLSTDNISFTKGDQIRLQSSNNGSYRIFKGNESVDLFYTIKKTIAVNKEGMPTEINSSDSVEMDGKMFVCGIENMDARLKKFSGEDADDTGYYLKPDASNEIITTDENYSTIRINTNTVSNDEEKNVQGLIIVDNESGLILAKHIRIKRTGSIKLNNKTFQYENHASIKMGIE